MPISEDVIKTLMVGTADSDLLVSIAADHLHERANTALPLNPLPLPLPAAHEVQRVCNPHAMRHLSLILSGMHSALLKEWLVTAARANRCVSADMLPSLLLIGLRRADWRPYVLPVIGERGHWLAAEIRNQNWRWIFDPSILHFEAALAQEREQESAFIDIIQSNQFTMVITELMRYRTPWSTTLMDVFLAALERVERSARVEDWWLRYYLSRLTTLMYFFPLNSYGETQRRFQQARAFREQPIFDRLQTIGDLRRNLFAAIHRSENAQ